MTPVEHILFGFSTGNIIYSTLRLMKKKSIQYFKLIILIIIAASIADIDSFFGKYTSINPIIGHRGVTHSILGSFVFALSLTLLYIPLKNREMKNIHYAFNLNEREILSLPKEFAIIFIACLIGALTHVAADLPQPASIWKGIPVLFPYKKHGAYHRIGGFSYIGWYDYKIIINMLFAALASIFTFLLYKIFYKKGIKKTPEIILISIIIINTFAMGWVIKYTISSKYINRRQWEIYQKKVITSYPKEVQFVIIQGRKKFLKIFFEMRKKFN